MLRPHEVYLVNYACFRTASNCCVPFTFLEHNKQAVPAFNERSIGFMTKLLVHLGLREETCLPPAHHYIPTHK
jgi:3-ketoacyl-CoA synthase